MIVRFEGDRVQDFCFGSADAKPLTLSFWVRSSKTGTYIIEMSGGSRLISQAYTITTADTWQKIIITVPGQTAAKLTTGVSSSFELYFWLGAGTTFTSGTLNTSWAASVPSGNRAVGQVNFADSNTATFFLTAVQLEIGSTATALQTATGTIQGELAACQRYYQRFAASGNRTRIGGVGAFASTTIAYTVIPFETRMRTAVTAVEYGGTLGLYDYNTEITVTTLAIVGNSSGVDTATIQANVASGGTQYRPVQLEAFADANAYIAFSAEL
jgi:hypothetical protein